MLVVEDEPCADAFVIWRREMEIERSVGCSEVSKVSKTSRTIIRASPYFSGVVKSAENGNLTALRYTKLGMG